MLVIYNGEHYVALRKESVDRNPESGAMGITIKVALRKESVDRNKVGNAMPGG